MRILSLLLLALPATAADFSLVMRDVATPVYDASGHPIRRLTADSASGPFASPRLEKAKIDFFSLASSKVPTAVLTCEHALYQRATETIKGEDLVQLSTPKGVVSGHGYVCRIDAGLLTLNAKVTFAADRAVLRGTHAEIRFDPKGGKQDEVIREVVVSGTVTLEQIPAHSGFDRAETTHARYDAAQQKIFLKTPVTTWSKGQKSVVNIRSGFVEIDVGEKAHPAPTFEEPTMRP